MAENRIVRCPLVAETIDASGRCFAETVWTSLERNSDKLALVRLMIVINL